MRPVRRYRPIEFHQTCAIARVVLLRDPTVDNFEWKEAVKETCIKQGYDEPQGDMLPRALAAVEAALAREGRPRPPVQVNTRPSSPTCESHPLTHAEAVDALAQLGARGLVKAMPEVPRFTQHQADSLLVIKLLARATIDQIQRCEEAERAAAAAEAAAREARANEEPTS